ncbi:alpha/beta hydrolase family protein [Ancylomarina sp. 16SWW S1-10-2]|uniref:alpha/beta hydrolase n=1 Tax=Ancylomarina sp. 16SWW S1-10-2 TaxID=2499681 RepID=UPI0012ADA229|nr:alpha/beta hydrolase family protein [Ancylomarina sp. 16SWW S1-10-2]MRT93806.1 esterase family protein [Ancylomarina sp. 16SWW S1-10-2]
MRIVFVLFLLVSNALCAIASRVDTLMVSSKSMDKELPNLVIVPDGYSTDNKDFPVLYLLHGASGNFGDWLHKVPKLQEYVDTYDFIIVCPDGGFTSWYFDSLVDDKMQYETYITKELLPAVDKNYNTIPDRSGRAIAGLSMGGHGAFYLAFKHQDIWGAAGSTSGGLDIRPFPSRWDISKRLGSYAENKEAWEKNSVINLVYLLNGNNLKLIFDCGTEDFFHGANKRMHEKLLERNIPHDYIERPGKHNVKYWSNSIKYQLLFFDQYFESEKK